MNFDSFEGGQHSVTRRRFFGIIEPTPGINTARVARCPSMSNWNCITPHRTFNIVRYPNRTSQHTGDASLHTRPASYTQVMILHPQTGHGGVRRQPCRPRLLAGRSLSSAALSWSDDDVYRLARALASWHRACFLLSSTLSGSVVDFLDRRHREQHDGIWSSRVST